MKFKGFEVKYNSYGDASDTILFLHPAFGDSTVFDKQVEFFKNDYQVITIDFFGHGVHNHHKLTLLDQVDVCYEVLKAENTYRAHLVGVSLGAIFAQGIVDKYPQMVDSVTIVGGYSIHKDNEDIIEAQQNEIRKWFYKMLFSMKKFRDYITRVSAFTKEGQKVFRASTMKFRKFSLVKMRGADSCFRTTLDPVAYPLLVIVGKHDLPLTKQAAKDFEKDGHQVEEFDGAGHCVNLDKPEIFNEIVSKFIKDNA